MGKSAKKVPKGKYQLKTRIQKAGKGEQVECPARAAEGCPAMLVTDSVSYT